MEEKTYEVPICDPKMPKRNKIFFVKINQYGEILEYMTQNVTDFRSVTNQEVKQQIEEFLRKKNKGSCTFRGRIF